MDLLSASIQDSGILKSEVWPDDELLNSILMGNGALSDDQDWMGMGDNTSTGEDNALPDFDTNLLSPSDSSDSGNSGSITPANIDLLDGFGNDSNEEDDTNLQGVNPLTNSPENEEEVKDKIEQPKMQRVTLRATRNNPKRIASTNVYHHAAKSNISVMRPITAGGVALQPAINATPITLANAGQSSIETGTTTIYLPVIKNVQQPTIIRMNAPPTKRRRVSASSSESGSDDLDQMRFPANMDKSKYPRLELNDEERKLCEKEAIVLPSHYPLTKEEERNLKRIRRKIRNKQSAQDSRKRKKEHVENMEARAMKCAKENADLAKRLNALEAQNKSLVGQLKRLHQIIVNRGGISSSNVVAQAAMGNKGQTSTALMVLLLSTALFLIPGMREQFETKPSLDIMQAVKGPPIPGQSRSLLHFSPQNIKEEYPANSAQETPAMNANNDVKVSQPTLDNDKNSVLSAFGDHDYVTMKPDKKKSYIVADVPPLGYGDQKIMLDHRNNISQEIVVVTSERKRENVEDEEGDERRLNVSVTGGESGPRTIVLHVPKGMK